MLRRLAMALLETVLRSRADSTTKKYLGAFKRWNIWANARHGVPSFRVQEIHLVLYLQHLSESSGSIATVEEAMHALMGGSLLVNPTLEGLKQILAKPKFKRNQ